MICMWLVPPEYDFGGVLNTVLLFYDAQKSGPLSTSTNYVPWRGDSGMEDAWSDMFPLTGGFHDSGGGCWPLLTLCKLLVVTCTPCSAHFAALAVP